ncbi:MAG: MATE family efflux transporter [Lachnospiraceae bacterium]|nr:MATE family efflux transporter [Lachnospiraceae bacterium]
MKKNGNRAGMESYRMIMRLALPIVIQNLFSAAISSTDVIMLNSVGQSAVSAVSLATQYSSVLYMVFYGIGTGATMLCAQYWGQGNTQAIEKIEGIALRFSLGISLLFAVPSAVVPGLMMTLFTSDQELIQIGASYLRIVSISFLCWGFSEVYLAILRSVEKVKISTALNVSALLINVCLNAVFVYGLFGAPRLGAQGVAIATAISRGIQLIACFGVSIVSGNAVRLRPEAMFWKSGVLMQDFLHLAVPAVANDISWSVAFSMYSVIMGHMGTDVVAANAIVVVVRNFGTVLCYSIASASGIYVGKKIGANQLEEAERDASRSMQLTVASGIFGGILVAASMPFVLPAVSLSDTARGYLKIMLLINTYYITGSAVNTTLIAGIFRAGGDSRFGLICDTIDMWCYGVPLGFFAAFVLKLPPMWVYFLLCTDEFVKWPWVIHHYRSRKWLKNITRENV